MNRINFQAIVIGVFCLLVTPTFAWAKPHWKCKATMIIHSPTPTGPHARVLIFTKIPLESKGRDLKEAVSILRENFSKELSELPGSDLFPKVIAKKFRSDIVWNEDEKMNEEFLVSYYSASQKNICRRVIW